MGRTVPVWHAGAIGPNEPIEDYRREPLTLWLLFKGMLEAGPLTTFRGRAATIVQAGPVMAAIVFVQGDHKFAMVLVVLVAVCLLGGLLGQWWAEASGAAAKERRDVARLKHELEQSTFRLSLRMDFTLASLAVTAFIVAVVLIRRYTS